MSKPQSSLPCLLLILFSAALFHSSQADVGTAAQYRPPYLPTACGGRDQRQFPPGYVFASSGEGIWDNGASCGRQYQVRCISAPVVGTCVPGNRIEVKIVDRALSSVSRPSRSDATIYSSLDYCICCNSQLVRYIR